MSGYTPGWAVAFPEPHDDGDGTISRQTVARREPPAVCPVCGADVPDRPFFGDVTCGARSCREAGR
jgi:hypothetical protein